MKPLGAALFAASLLLGSVALPSVAQAETPADQLIVALSMSNLITLDPAALSGKESVQAVTNVYQGLVNLDPVDRSNLIATLAESWTVSDDAKSIIFTIREAATFASGNPVTAADVKWSLDRLLDLNLTQAAKLSVFGLNSDTKDEAFVVQDERTFVINLPQPTDPNLVVMTLGVVGPGSIIDSKLAMEHEVNGDKAAAWLATNTAGSGPFVVSQLRSNEMLLLDRNDNYWGEAPAMRRIVMRHLPESQSQRLQLERGDIDVAYSLAAPDLAALSGNDDTIVQTNGGGGFYYLAASMSNEVLADQNVRLALRYLVDYDGVNAAVMPFYGVSHQRPVHAGLLGDLPSPGYVLDVEKAKAYLAEAGYPDGLKLTIRTLPEAPFLSLATAIQGTLAQGGIEAEIIPGSGDQTYGAMRERNFDLIVGRSGGQVPHPDADLRALAYNPDNSDEARLVGLQGWRASFYDEQINELIDAAILETDIDKQRQMYEDVQRRYEEVVPAIQPISQVADSVAYRSDIVGLVLHPSWQTDLSRVSKQR